MKKSLTNMIIIMVIGTLLTGCNNKKDKSEQDLDQTDAKQTDQFIEKTRDIIREISELECKLLTLYAEERNNDNGKPVNPEIRQLRDEKIRLIEVVLQDNPDSIQIQAFQKELQALRNAEDYCPEYKKLMMQKKKAGKNGVTDHQAKIRDDAEELAAINCRILQTRKKIEEGQGSIENKKELRKLTDEKWRFFDRIMLIYGQNIMKDTFFRKLVTEAQEKNCNYHKEVSSLKRDGSTSR